MAEDTAKEIVLKCVNALELLSEETTSIKQLSDGRWFARLLVIIKNEDITSGETDKIVGALESLLKDHFAGPKVINFDDAVTGNELELTKLTLLLLYITFVSSAKLNNRLIHSPLLTSSTQLKLKYLIESIQKRGSGMSAKFLNILCQEKLENKNTGRCYTPVESVAPWGSPHVYSSSPKAANGGSPLKELAQSPPFRMQRLLNAKVLELKKLQQKIHSIDSDKQELEIKYESSQKKVSKLSDALAKCQEDLKDQHRLRDELESKLSSGEDLVQQQVQRLSMELNGVRKENSSLEDTVRRIMDSNDELVTKNTSLNNRLILVTAEREMLEEEVSSLLRAKSENDSLIDDQAEQIHEFKAQLEELHQCLLESKKSANFTIEESFECGSPMNFSSATSPPHEGSAPTNISGENMADMVIDKILIETREQLTSLQEQHASLEEQYKALQNQLEEVTGSRDQLCLKIAVLESEINKLQQERDIQDTAFSTLTTEHEAEKMALVSAKQELEEILAKERSSTGEVIKAQEEALNDLKQEVENALKVHACEKNDLIKQNEQKQAEVDEVKKDMENHMTKCDELISSLKSQITEKETLLHNLQEETAKVNEEKENLSMSLQAKEDSYSNLKMEMDKTVALIKEERNKEIAMKEDVIADMEREIKNTVEKYRTENEHLKDLYEAKKETLSLLQEKLQESSDSIRTEKDSLLQNLLTSQKELAALQRTHEIAQESYEKDLQQLHKEIQEKNECICSLKDEMASKLKDSEETVKQLECNLEKVATEAGLYKTKNDELIEKIDTLEKSVATNKAEYEIELSKVREEYDASVNNLRNRLAETTTELEELERQKCEMVDTHSAEIAQLCAALSQEKLCSESLQQNSEKDNEQSILKIRALNEEIATIKSKLTYVEETLNEKEGSYEKNVETLMAEKKELEISSKSTIEELTKCVNEKMAEIEILKKAYEESQSSLKLELEKAQHCLLDKEESAKILESNKDGIIFGLQNEITSLNAKLASLEGDVTTKDKIYLENMDELKLAQQETKKYVTQVRELEAKLIDLEKAVTVAKEETMRVEREHERSSRSLNEELKATKEKYRAERQTAVDKMKATFTTEIQKLMIQVEEKEHEMKTSKVFQHKYEVAKKKLADTLTELNEAKTSSKHYLTQMTKYRELMSKLTDNLKKEQARNAELSEMHQPLKENLKEAEAMIKRLDNEKRSLEVQVQLADSQLRDLKRQQNFENINTLKAPDTKMKTRASVSESQLLKVTVTKAPSSSTDDELSGNDSTQKLLGNKSQQTRSRPKTISRAASAETVFRKPEAQTVTNNARQRSANVANLAASSSSSRLRKENIPMAKSSSNKSLGQSVPRDMLFNCEDEEELFSNKYLLDMQIGRCNPLDDAQWRRLSELQRRNSLYPPHMRSAYPAEMQFTRLEDFEDDKLRAGCAVEDRHLLNLTEATENLALDSPAFNLRKRKSLSDSTNSEISIDSIGSKKNKRLSTSYSRPGPPTPGRKSMNRGDKENRYDPDDSLVSTSSRESKQGGASGSPVTTRSRSVLKDSSARMVNSPSSSLSNSSRGLGSRSKRTTLSPGGVSFLSKKGVNITPRGKKGMTPSSLRKILSRGKSPWRKLDNDQETPKGLGDSTGSTGSSKLRIFRKPFGSRNYNVLSASRRSQENAHDLSNSLAASTGRSKVTTDRLHSRR